MELMCKWRRRQAKNLHNSFLYFPFCFEVKMCVGLTDEFIIVKTAQETRSISSGRGSEMEKREKR